MTHTLPRRLNAGVNTTGYWSLAPVGHLLVFVHGFGGVAEGTWTQFPRFLIGAPKFAGRDLVFYGYDGLKIEAFLSGVRLYRFLVKLIEGQLAQNTLPPYPLREPEFAFTRVTLIAHSLGAIVTRLALLEAYRAKAPWASSVDLVLYAPAHLGANVAPLVWEALSPFKVLAPVKALAKYRYQVLRDLEPGSTLLKRLADDSRAAWQSGNAPNVKARKVLVTVTDRVVDNQRFCEDPAPEEIDNVSHITICKPDDRAHQAYRHLEDVL